MASGHYCLKLQRQQEQLMKSWKVRIPRGSTVAIEEVLDGSIDNITSAFILHGETDQIKVDFSQASVSMVLMITVLCPKVPFIYIG